MSRHPDDDALAAVALGDGVSADVAHVDSCAACRIEVEAYVDAMSRVASAGAVPLTAPPARVWDAIVADIAEPAPAVVDELAQRRERRGSRWFVGVAAAAAGVIVGGVGAVAIVSGGSGLDGTVVASAPLASLADDAPAGTAEVVQRDDGSEVLVIDTTSVPVEDAYLEVWLIDTSVEGMISLGPLTGDHAELVIPAGFDVGAFPIVDISVEPLDGVPTHSGDSVTRGVLEQ
ncbi:anti-sigma factor [Demequina sp. NBRC 110052]|uniref:anti-sigma factor n=1 Tax=Demequina sp. NBRC 110052 TaxID=1570341 RepID=UPI000A05E72E|nr:anti-sigma factor [Demequina sp. NBRC 110052]